MNVLDLFSGIGGFSLGLERAGMRTVAFCEIEPYCRAVLKTRWPDVPCYPDIRELTAEKLAADGIRPDFIAGGFPCQDISLAGAMVGLGGTRSGLWWEYRRLIGELRPTGALIENVSSLRNFGLDTILGSLAEIRYDAEWHCVPAAFAGAPHRRDRIWIVAYPHGQGLEGRKRRTEAGFLTLSELPAFHAPTAFPHELPASAICRTGDGVSARVDRSRALGNSIVPQIAEAFGRAIMRCVS